MISRKTGKTLLLATLALGLVALLVGCGDNTSTSSTGANPNAVAPTSTPIPTFTPAPAGSNAGGPQMIQIKPNLGTVESYDAASKLLTIKGSDGKSQKFNLGNTKIMKSEKVSAAEFGKLLTADSNVEVVGDKVSDGVYTARALTLLDGSTFQVIKPGESSNPASAGGDTLKVGTPGVVVSTTGPGTLLPEGSPGTNQFISGPVTPGQGQVNTPLIVREAKLENNQLTGSNPLNNEAITVKLTGDTKLTRQTPGKPEDLKAGQTVRVTAQSAQGETPGEALFVSIE